MIKAKTQSEIDMMRRSADLVGRTLAEVAPMIEPGVLTSALDEVAEKFIRANGAEPSFKGYGPATNPFPSALCTSVNDEVVHGIPRDRVLEEGDIVSVDCGVFLNGFHGDSAYTFAVGEISDDTRHLLRTTYQALLAGIERARTGGRVGDIGYAVSQVCRAEGFGVVVDLVGHGIGRSLHEPPQVPNVGHRGVGKKLRSGVTICIEPMINQGGAAVSTDSDGWTVRAADGLPSAHYEHMVVIDATPLQLTTFEYVESVISPPYLIEEDASSKTEHGQDSAVTVHAAPAA